MGIKKLCQNVKNWWKGYTAQKEVQNLLESYGIKDIKDVLKLVERDANTIEWNNPVTRVIDLDEVGDLLILKLPNELITIAFEPGAMLDPPEMEIKIELDGVMVANEKFFVYPCDHSIEPYH